MAGSNNSVPNTKPQPAITRYCSDNGSGVTLRPSNRLAKVVAAISTPLISRPLGWENTV